MEDAPVVLRLPCGTRLVNGRAVLWPGGPEGDIIAYVLDRPAGVIADFRADDLLRHIERFEEQSWDDLEEGVRINHADLST